MNSPFIAFERDSNGAVKNMNLSPLMRGVADAQITTIEYAYQSVPWLYRGATLIAQAISSVPYSIINSATGEAIEEDDRLASLNDWMVTTLYHAALSRTLYGSAYFLIESNPFGYNNTPRFIPSPAVVVNWNYTAAEIQNFRILLSGKSKPVEPNRMMWSWVPNPFSETEPGIAPAYVALQAAGMLAALDQMATRYFKSGAVPITAIKVSPSTSKDDKEKLEGWFSRFATGFRNVSKFLAVNKDTEFQTLGANVKETQAFELTNVQRDNVAVALGVPPTVLDGKSANYATASSEMMGFYLHTVIPNCEQIEEHFNMRLFARYGLEFQFAPEKLEIMQSAQLEQAQTLMQLTGRQAVLTVDEARDWLGLEPMTPAQQEETEPPPPVAQSTADNAAVPESVDTEAEAPPDDEQMKAWREQALTLFRAGSPVSVGAPFDAELQAASSAKLIRGVFETHWHKPTHPTPTDWRMDAIRELARYNALAQQGAING